MSGVLGDWCPATRTRRELDELEPAYRGAIARGMSAGSTDAIDAAFDEADRLQMRMLVLIQRLRARERLAPACDRSAGRRPSGRDQQGEDDRGVAGEMMVAREAA